MRSSLKKAGDVPLHALYTFRKLLFDGMYSGWAFEITYLAYTNYHHLITAVSVIKKLTLYEFTLWGRDLVAVVRIRESPYYGGFFKKKVCDNFVGTLITVRYKEVSVTRGSTIFSQLPARLGRK